MGENEIKIINCFKENPELSMTEISIRCNVARSLVSRYLKKHEDELLPNGRTIKSQIEINKVEGKSNGGLVVKKEENIQEKQIVDFFKANPSVTLQTLANKFGVSKTLADRYLRRHLDESALDGEMIITHIKRNQEMGRKAGANKIGKNSVAVKQAKTGRFIGSISTLDGNGYEITDAQGVRIGSVLVADHFEEEIIREAIYYLTHDLTLKETSKELQMSDKKLRSHFKHLSVVNANLYRLVEIKKKENHRRGILNRKPSGGRPTFYSDELIEEIAKRIISNQYTYMEAELEFGIPKSTLFELMQRVSPDLRDQLDLVAYENVRNKSIQELKEARKI